MRQAPGSKRLQERLLRRLRAESLMPPKAKVIEAAVETGPAWTERLIGHEAAEQAFLKAFAAGRLPHAWLISGPQGVGKATFALGGIRLSAHRQR